MPPFSSLCGSDTFLMTRLFLPENATRNGVFGASQNLATSHYCLLNQHVPGEGGTFVWQSQDSPSNMFGPHSRRPREIVLSESELCVQRAVSALLPPVVSSYGIPWVSNYLLLKVVGMGLRGLKDRVGALGIAAYVCICPVQINRQHNVGLLDQGLGDSRL